MDSAYTCAWEGDRGFIQTNISALQIVCVRVRLWIDICGIPCDMDMECVDMDHQSLTNYDMWGRSSELTWESASVVSQSVVKNPPPPGWHGLDFRPFPLMPMKLTQPRIRSEISTIQWDMITSLRERHWAEWFISLFQSAPRPS